MSKRKRKGRRKKPARIRLGKIVSVEAKTQGEAKRIIRRAYPDYYIARVYANKKFKMVLKHKK